MAGAVHAWARAAACACGRARSVRLQHLREAPVHQILSEARMKPGYGTLIYMMGTQVEPPGLTFSTALRWPLTGVFPVSALRGIESDLPRTFGA